MLLALLAGCSSLGDDLFPKAPDAGPADAAPDAVPDAQPADAAPADGSASVTAMPTYQRHVFVCVNERTPGHPKGCCLEKGGEAVRDRFKKVLAARGAKGPVRANKAGCLDQCEYGVTVVVYPEQVWYGGVTVDDVDEIVDTHLLGGHYVERLMIPDQSHLRGATSGPPLPPEVLRPIGKKPA